MANKLNELIRQDDEGFHLSELHPCAMTGFGRYDWQSFVPGELRELWGELSLETRLALCFVAKNKAYNVDLS